MTKFRTWIAQWHGWVRAGEKRSIVDWDSGFSLWNHFQTNYEDNLASYLNQSPMVKQPEFETELLSLSNQMLKIHEILLQLSLAYAFMAL